MIVDCDVIAREVVEPGRWAYKKLVAAFGVSILNNDKTINRKLLRERAFANPRARAQLNRATHTSIMLEIFKQIAFYRIVQWQAVVVLDAPLLFETFLDRVCATVVVVSCDEHTQIARLVARDGCTQEQAHQIINAQLPLSLKCQRADVVLDNSGRREDLPAKVDALLHRA